MTKPNLKIVKIEEHENAISFNIEVDPDGDGIYQLKERVTYGWDIMDEDNDGQPRYKHALKKLAKAMINTHKKKNDFKAKKPKKDEIIEFDNDE